MKRLLKILVLLMVGLFLIASGINVALDRMTNSVSQNSFSLYNEKGNAVVTYNGDLTLCRLYPRPGTVPALTPPFLHRT